MNWKQAKLLFSIILLLFILTTDALVFSQDALNTPEPTEDAEADVISRPQPVTSTPTPENTETVVKTPMEIAKDVVVILYFSIIYILCIYGFHRLVLVLLFALNRHKEIDKPDLLADSDLPIVTIQLPLFNERTVAERSILAMLKVDYPRDKFEVQVLDDSTDNTVDLCKELVEKLKTEGVDAVHIHRTDRTGYKAGALENGMRVAKGELIAIFDADFVIPETFLKDMIPYFQNEKIGMVQAKWDHLNRDYSRLTKTQAVMLDAHFVVEHFTRNRTGRYFNFNGTAGIWRKNAINEAGGWQHETITEDMDLSYRAQLKGWEFLYIPDVSAPAELPVEMDAFKSQQYRWTKGSTQVCFKILPKILRSKIPFKIKAEAFIHLTANFSYVLLFLLSLLMVPAIYARLGGGWQDTLIYDFPVFLFGTLFVLDYFITGQRMQGKSFQTSLKDSLFVIAVGMGLSINNARAVMSAVFGRKSAFVRTPKYGISENGEAEKEVVTQKRYKPQKSIIPYLEVLFCAYFIGSILWAFAVFAWPSIPFLLLFAVGFGYNGWLSMSERRKRDDD